MPPDAAETFEQHRGILFGVAYRMLGTVAEAEDVVQEAWLRWDRTDRSSVADPRSYLIQVATRVAIDQLRRARAQRETYVGPWLPEPLLTTPDATSDVEVAESVSVALLLVLETLSPLERAVFVLREAFGFTYPEIAAALGRSPEAVRQLAHRAREHVEARRPRFRPDRGRHRAVTERFLDAALGGDLAALLEVLAPEVNLVADSGGKALGPRRPIVGADRVARFLAGRAHAVPAGTELDYTDVNGEPAAIMSLDGRPYTVLFLVVAPHTGLVEMIRLVGNPDKLSRLTNMKPRQQP